MGPRMGDDEFGQSAVIVMVSLDQLLLTIDRGLAVVDQTNEIDNND